MGMAYRRTSGRCQRCFQAFASAQVVTMVQEHLIAEEYPSGCVCTTEWVAVCSACATPAEQAAATKQDVCRGCEQPLLLPPRYRSRVAVCSSRCAQRCRRRERREWRRSISCRGCATVFQPSRSDSHYCTAACRQKAYRRRVIQTPIVP